MISSKPRNSYSFRTVAVFALGTVLIASGFYLFVNRQVAGPESASNAELKINAQSASKTQKESEQARTANQKIAKEADDLKRPRAAAEQSSGNATKLSEDLKKSETARKIAEAKAAKLTNDLKKAESNVDKLKQQLEKERALQANKVSKPEEAAKPTRTDESTATK